MDWNSFRGRVHYLSEQDQQRVAEAFLLGSKMHEGQVRLSGDPYFTHPVAVATMLTDMHADRDTIVAALLHDTVEDTSLTLMEITRLFNPSVAYLIDGVTRLQEDAGDPLSLDEQRIEYLRKMFLLMQRDVRIVVIKLADRLHNMQTSSFVPEEKRKNMAQETYDIYVKIADRLSMRDMQYALEELCLLTLEPEEYARLNEIRKKNRALGEKYIPQMDSALRAMFGNIDVSIGFEEKMWEKLREQLQLSVSPSISVNPINAAFVCENDDMCYKVLGMLHRLWHREILSFEDYINEPLINGYRGLHTTVILDDGTRIRCAIRTRDMQEYAHKGIAIRCFEEQNYNAIDMLPWTARIHSVSQQTEDKTEEFWNNVKSDILGEAIVVYGPSNERALLPLGSTALDAVFHLFGKRALRIVKIRANGKEINFYDHLKEGDTITADFAETVQTHVGWLRDVRTGIASSQIRQALVDVPDERKIAVGRQLLEAAVRRAGGVALEELQASYVLKEIAQLHILSLPELYRQIAESKIDPENVAALIVPDRGANLELRPKRWKLTVKSLVPVDDILMKHLQAFSFLRMVQKKSYGKHRLQFDYLLTPGQVRDLEILLASRLHGTQWTLQAVRLSRSVIGAMLVLVLLWGLDPVIAKFLLLSGITPHDLTLMRFLSFFIATFAMVFTQQHLTGNRLRPLPFFRVSLITSSLAHFFTALFTYLALESIAATAYVLLVFAGQIFTAFIAALHRHRPSWHLLLSLAVILSMIMLFARFEELPWRGMLMGAVASFTFSVYSIASRRYQRSEETIHARYPAYLLWIGVYCLMFSLTLVPFSQLHTLSLQLLADSILFAIAYNVVPYALYFECLRRTESKLLDRTLPYVCIASLISDVIIFRSFGALALSPFLLIFVWLFTLQRRDVAID